MAIRVSFCAVALLLGACASAPKDRSVLINLAVDHEYHARTLKSESLADFVALVRSEPHYEDEFYYVRIFRASERRIYTFYLRGQRAAPQADIARFRLQGGDDVAFAGALP